MDDIILAYPKEKGRDADQIITSLRDKYALTGGDDLQWFLGIEITRSWQQKLIQLSQSSYIKKISQLTEQTNLWHNTLMASVEQVPFKGLATALEVN